MGECRSPKPKVAGSSPAAPATLHNRLWDFCMILKKWVVIFFQVLSEVKKVDWFPKEDLFGVVSRILLVIGVVSIVFLGFDWLISQCIYLFLKF